MDFEFQAKSTASEKQSTTITPNLTPVGIKTCILSQVVLEPNFKPERERSQGRGPRRSLPIDVPSSAPRD
jgi:hypothetical protein